MTKVFLSGPMTGRADYNRPAFNAAAAMLRGRGFDVANPAELPDGHDYSWYMNECKKMLSRCEAIYLLPGWMDSEGAKQEAVHATRRGMAVWEVLE
jgi:hypothetical protein